MPNSDMAGETFDRPAAATRSMLHDPDSCDKSPANAGGQLIGMSAEPALAPWALAVVSRLCLCFF
jgi:hypothetical protein